MDRFHDPELNAKRGHSSFFTTHDTSILSQDVFRRDQVWFCERNARQETNLFPLTDFPSSPRSRETWRRAYLGGTVWRSALCSPLPRRFRRLNHGSMASPKIGPARSGPKREPHDSRTHRLRRATHGALVLSRNCRPISAEHGQHTQTCTCAISSTSYVNRFSELSSGVLIGLDSRDYLILCALRSVHSSRPPQSCATTCCANTSRFSTGGTLVGH